MRLLEMTTHEVARMRPRLCFWPVGTIEAHDMGPLGTDVIAPQKLAEDLADQFEALLLPTLPFGLNSSLAGYPGGMWLSDETYEQAVFELLCSLRRSGVRSVVVFNGHGGNSSALARALQRAWKQCWIRVAVIDWWSLVEDLSEQYFGSAGGHGGADELALVHAANPALTPASWDGSRAFLLRRGVKSYPAPRPALKASTSPPKPFNAESARLYYDGVRERLERVIQEIVDGWSAFQALEE